MLSVAPSLADIFPGSTRYHDICLEIINGVASNSIEFKQRYPPCPLLNCQPAETISRSVLCQRLVSVHNVHAASYIGGIFIYPWDCLTALASTQPYLAADWSNWAGKHCGKWWQIDGSGSVFVDNAVWHSPTTTYDIATGETFYRQDVVFDRYGTCCDDGWNESGGTVSPKHRFAKDKIILL